MADPWADLPSPTAIPPTYPVKIENSTSVGSSAPNQLNYYTLTGTAPNATWKYPAGLENGSEVGMSLCVKFLNNPNPNPLSTNDLQNLYYLVIEGAALYRNTGDTFSVVRKALNLPFFSHNADIHPTVTQCPAGAAGC